MPFVSQQQRRWMHATHPEMAARWEKETPKGKLPRKVKPVPPKKRETHDESKPHREEPGDTNPASRPHPGFKAVQAKIAARQGVGKDRAGAILAAGARKAGPAAVKKNPRLKKVRAIAPGRK